MDEFKNADFKTPPLNFKQPHKNWFLSHKVLTSVILVLLLVVVLGIIDYGILQKETQNNIDQSLQSNSMADWKTYRNEEYMFEFKYPSGWEVNEDKDIITINKKTEPGNSAERIIFNIGPDQGSFDNNFNYLRNTLGEEFFEYIPYETDLGWGGKYKIFETKDGGGGPNIVMYIISDNNIVIADGAGNPGPIKEFQPQFFEILSTFKFIEKTGINTQDVINKLENWSIYKSSTLHVGTGDCGGNEFEGKLNQLNSGMRYSQEINGLILLYTPNYSKWSNEKFVSFNAGDNNVCGTGGIYPLHAYTDKLLWVSSCGGVLPEDPEKAQKVRDCGATSKIIDDYYNGKS